MICVILLLLLLLLLLLFLRRINYSRIHTASRSRTPPSKSLGKSLALGRLASWPGQSLCFGAISEWQTFEVSE